MPFTLIKGKYTPKLGIPDGDTVRFVADNLELWNKLDGRGVKINESNKSVPLRLEGIDAIEKGATKPLSVNATENLLKLIKSLSENSSSFVSNPSTSEMQHCNIVFYLFLPSY